MIEPVIIGTAKLYNADCREALKLLPDNSVDSIVTDPPYELGFMGKSWDSTGIAYDVDMWRECLRVLKPGGHLLSFSGSRTYHRMTCAIEDAGFEIRDQIMWIYGSGFPKSLNLDGDWSGWGTALKPAHEPICVARKPIEGTVTENVAAYGTGVLNIDACRVGKESSGRWPANVIHDGSDEVVALFPETSSGVMKAGTKRAAQDEPGSVCYGTFGGDATEADTYGDTGSAARFFYCAKASREDRNEGCEAMAKKPLLWSSGTQNPGSFQGEGTDRSSQNNHPTVKPTDLMAYLCRLVTPPGGTVLDPFMGSGSTGKAAWIEGFNFIGIELNPAYFEIAKARVKSVPVQEGMFA